MRGHLGLAALGGAVGAGLMYMLDPQMGRRRRALLRDKSISVTRQTVAVVDKTSRDLRNRAHGTIVSIKSGHPLRGGLAVFNSNWPPAVRLVMGTIGAIATAAGLTRAAGRSGPFLGTAGIASALYAITNFSVRDAMRRRLGERRSQIAAPQQKVA